MKRLKNYSFQNTPHFVDAKWNKIKYATYHRKMNLFIFYFIYFFFNTK